MDTSLERIRAKLAEFEAKIANLRIAERELLDLDKPSIHKTKVLPAEIIKSAVEVDARPVAAKADAEPVRHQTIGAAITDVLQRHGALSASAIAEQIVATGRDINNRAVSFALQALKKKGLVKSADGEWSLGKARAKRGR
jgi:hypothetical protein